jgi:DNA invertase Pin-like site-specific DNA recombinase
MQGDIYPHIIGGRRTMTNKIKVAAYCRVSTDMEDQLHSLSAQIKYFTEYISNHDNYELIEVYYDVYQRKRNENKQ